MFDAVNERLPEANAQFERYYGMPAMCLYELEDGTVEIIWSEEGSRMGCPLGPTGFGLTVQSTYERVKSAYPDFTMKALTDDLTLAAPLPDREFSKEDILVRCGEVFRLISQDSKERNNLSLNFEKCTLLLPPDWPDPPKGCLPDGITVLRDGMTIAGSPIGKDSFVTKSTADIIDKISTKMSALEGIDPQVGFSLLRQCIVPALSYVSHTVPTCTILEQLKTYDDRMPAYSNHQDPRIPCHATDLGYCAPTYKHSYPSASVAVGTLHFHAWVQSLGGAQ